MPKQKKQAKKQEQSDMQDLAVMPQKYKELWVTNRRLLKQIDILNMQICEKDRIIKELKVQIDSSILEDTKNRLEFVRMVEDEVNEKTQQAKQEYLDKLTNFESEFEKRATLMFQIQKQLEFCKGENMALRNSIKELKQHVLIALEEKDLIIMELSKIISGGQIWIRPQNKILNVFKPDKQNIARKFVENQVNEDLYHKKMKKILGLGERDLNIMPHTSKVVIKKNL